MKTFNWFRRRQQQQQHNQQEEEQQQQDHIHISNSQQQQEEQQRTAVCLEDGGIVDTGDAATVVELTESVKEKTAEAERMKTTQQENGVYIQEATKERKRRSSSLSAVTEETTAATTTTTRRRRSSLSNATRRQKQGRRESLKDQQQRNSSLLSITTTRNYASSCYSSEFSEEDEEVDSKLFLTKSIVKEIVLDRNHSQYNRNHDFDDAGKHAANSTKSIHSDTTTMARTTSSAGIPQTQLQRGEEISPPQAYSQPGAHAVQGRTSRRIRRRQNHQQQQTTTSTRRRSLQRRRRRSSDGLLTSLSSHFRQHQHQHAVSPSHSFDGAPSSSSSSLSLVQADLVTESELVVYADKVSQDDLAKRRRIIFLGAILSMVIIGILFGVVFYLVVQQRRRRRNDNLTTNNACTLRSLREQDIVTICTCRGNAIDYFLTEQEEEFYLQVQIDFLQEGIIETNYTRASCQAENQALLFASSMVRSGFGLEKVNFIFFRVLVQRYVLAMLYITTGGYNSWSRNDGWLEPGLICDWYGVECSFLERLEGISLVNNNLMGTIPSALGHLGFAEYVDLSENAGLHGTLPDSLQTFTLSLHKLSLHTTNIGGTIPPFIYRMTLLDDLNLANTTINGTIPSAMGNLERLRYLNLGNNTLSGTIPNEFGNLLNLEHLHLPNNQLEGTLPDSLATLEFLEVFDIVGNQFSGTIPSYVGRGTWRNLNAGLFADNRFVGSVPESICDVNKNLPVDFDLFMVDCIPPFPVERNCSCCNVQNNNNESSSILRRGTAAVICLDDFSEDIKRLFT